ncbi:methionine-binding protein [Clostridium beijerinckii]|uniref:Metal ABC transporter substrate-binding protein n=1 Tax=Clostridium beijerinckii TaxID=1520 RepID=A0AB74VA88_CLOBE|nr:MetQ/NlpA family ABC transporter substrate-binding protein [Clostridium beijerinckii]NRZ27536.1 D-methionine transport system substrate-binding protein [Clostridium beijerinckii]NYB96675.1 D-methionine transport system substrate-binding protein [Clostridium beijerinckii]OOM26064.1 putative D-methionine-binding lipoprotein MetQ precursor [Clostridium beijerinckii]QUN33353.1 metal ABC transporter substrate-binding protein [Clostridium beijerinckii]SQB20012.1 ABC transporter periplasmic protei
MKKNIFTKIIIGLTTSLFALGLAGCGNSGSTDTKATEKKDLTIGISPGPYSELFTSAVKPILEKNGYTIKEVNFSDLRQADVALTEGSIDFNVDQHSAYANNFNKETNNKLTPITPIPTVPAGIFSNKHTSIDQVAKGQKVAIPNDPSNTARAFRLLKKAGWIKLKEDANPTTLTINDVSENTYNLDITLMDSAQIPRALDDIDFAVLPGSMVYASKIDPSKSLLSEDVSKELQLQVVVDEKNKDSKWANDIVEAYKSEEFKDYMAEHNKNNYWFIPDEIK